MTGVQTCALPIWDYVGAMKTTPTGKRYTAKPAEVSLVDNPCNPSAHFEYVKADGSTELRKFASVTVVEAKPESVVKTKDVVENKMKEKEKEKEEEKKDLKKEPSEKVTKLTNDIVISVFSKNNKVKSEEVTKLVGEGKLTKGIYELNNATNLLLSMGWLKWAVEMEAAAENDNSKLPDKIQANLEAFASTVLAMADEEVKELVEAAKKAGEVQEAVVEASGSVNRGNGCYDSCCPPSCGQPFIDRKSVV